MTRRNRLPMYRCFIPDQWRGSMKTLNREIRMMGLDRLPAEREAVKFAAIERAKYAAQDRAFKRAEALTPQSSAAEWISALNGTADLWTKT